MKEEMRIQIIIIKNRNEMQTINLTPSEIVAHVLFGGVENCARIERGWVQKSFGREMCGPVEHKRTREGAHEEGGHLANNKMLTFC